MRSKMIPFFIILLVIASGIAGAFYDRYSKPSGAVMVQENIAEKGWEAETTKDEKSLISSWGTKQDIERNVPVFSLPDLSGKSVSISGKDGTKTVFHFWATWCAPCILELPELVARAQIETNTRFVLISVDENVTAIDRFRTRLVKANHAINYNASNIIWLQDSAQTVMKDIFGTQKLPETYITDSEGRRLVLYFPGQADWKNIEF